MLRNIAAYLGTAALALALGALIAAHPTSASAQELRLEADLNSGIGGPASGTVKWEREGMNCLSPNGTRCKFGFEAEDFPMDGAVVLMSMTGCMVPVLIPAPVVGGRVEVDLDTDAGDTVPNCIPGAIFKLSGSGDMLLGAFVITDIEP